MEIQARNVNDAITSALWYLKVAGVQESSRNGPVIVAPEPVLTTYTKPQERVLFWGERDQNCIFTLMESLWMLAGRDDLSFVEYFNSRMRNFSDNGTTLNGAYGHRWRKRFGVDQLVVLIKHLKEDPTSRRAVLTMWGPAQDLQNLGSKDVCCNTQAYFEIRGGRLNMTVLCRSNDLIWGAYGANAVHFSFLQEFVASALDVPMGEYRQFSHNLHLYTELYDFKKYLDTPPDSVTFDAYQYGVGPRNIMDSDDWGGFLRDCERFCCDPFGTPRGYRHSFFPYVAYPMAMITKTRKEKLGNGLYWAERVEAGDWKAAALAWIERREA